MYVVQCSSCKPCFSESNSEDSCRSNIGGQAVCFLLDISVLFILGFCVTIEKFHVYSKRIYYLNVSNCTMHSCALCYCGKSQADIHQVSFYLLYFFLFTTFLYWKTWKIVLVSILHVSSYYMLILKGPSALLTSILPCLLIFSHLLYRQAITDNLMLKLYVTHIQYTHNIR